MYLPFGSSTLVRLLQLPLSLPNSAQPTPHLDSVAPDEQLRKHHLNLGNLSPYQDAPTVPRVSADLPDDCTVNQVILVSSQPGNELVP